MATLSAPSFDQINRGAGPYPAYLLPDGGTALSLFSAAFYGSNDVIHFARKNMVVTCVDTDDDRLWEMCAMYSRPWEYYVEDAWEFAADAAARGLEWDVVSVDPFMGANAEAAWDTLGLWCSLALKLVTLTVDPKRPIWAPPGWLADVFPRTPLASWMVLRRC